MFSVIIGMPLCAMPVSFLCGGENATVNPSVIGGQGIRANRARGCNIRATSRIARESRTAKAPSRCKNCVRAATAHDFFSPAVESYLCLAVTCIALISDLIVGICTVVPLLLTPLPLPWPSSLSEGRDLALSVEKKRSMQEVELHYAEG